MIYNYTSSKRVIGTVFRDFGIQRSDFINDAIEWIGEALELIGTARYPVDKVRIIKSEEFRVPIPKDMYILEKVSTSGTDDEEMPDRDSFKYTMADQGAQDNSGLYEQESDMFKASDYTYYHDGKFIKTSFKSGWLSIQYKAFPLDDDGYPMIPDAAEFTTALSWYIMSKLLLSGKKHPVINYKIADQKWQRKCVKARNAFNMPDKGQYRAFKEKWVTMIPRYDRNIAQLEEAVTAENVIEKSFSKNIIGEV